MFRKLSAAVLAAALTCSLCVPAYALEETDGSLSNFQKANTFAYGQFTDVPNDAWYTQSVASAFEYGLMGGTGPDTFAPDGSITLGATLAMASRLHSIYYTGKADFTQGTPWYQVYVDYCLENTIIDRNYANYDVPATRSEFAAILARSLPAEALAPMNEVDAGAIPDVQPSNANYDAIYQLYRAGILTGNDEKGSFAPDTTIHRSAVAAIITRMALKTERKAITLHTAPAVIPVTGVTLSQDTNTLQVGNTFQLTASVLPADATDPGLIWNSSNPAAASVSPDGIVTGISAGSAVITATSSSGASAQCTVSVVLPTVEVTSVSLNSYSKTMETGDTFYLSVSLQPSNVTNNSITWTSSNPSAVSVSQDGLVTAVSAGNADITATASNGLSATCYVTVTAPAPVYSNRYAEYPSVPDLGKVVGAPVAHSMQMKDGGHSYLYGILDVPDNWVDSYTSALENAGFSYLTGFNDDDGNPVIVFNNGSLSVAIGLMATSQHAYVSVMIIPN